MLEQHEKILLLRKAEIIPNEEIIFNRDRRIGPDTWFSFNELKSLFGDIPKREVINELSKYDLRSRGKK